MPRVSVICLSYRQHAYIRRAVTSALAYKGAELIVVDDASPDHTPLVLRDLEREFPSLKVIYLDKNVGMCAAFNVGLAVATGDYVLDLAGDDALVPGALEAMVTHFDTLDASVAVLHGDMQYIDAQDRVLRTHYRRDANGLLLAPVPQGWVYPDLVRGNFVASASMLMRRSALLEIGGYDPALVYEDYDAKVRLGRRWQFVFLNQLVVYKRLVPGADHLKWYSRAGKRHLESTLKIGEKILALNRTPEEDAALAWSMRWHMRLSLYAGCRELVPAYAQLVAKAVGGVTLQDRLWLLAARLPLPYNAVYRLSFLFRQI